MGNKQKKADDALIRNQMSLADKEYNSINTQMGLNSQQTVTNSNALRQKIQDQYSNSNNFMPGGLKPNAQGWFDLPGSDGKGGGSKGPALSAMGDYGSARSGYEKMAANGGVNRADFDPALESYKGFMGATGGVDVAGMRARGGSTIPAFYDQYKNASLRRANTQGGYSPGFDAQQAEMARQAGREGFNANRQLEGDISDKVQQGRMFGTTGYGGLMTNITGMEQTGKLAGLGGLTHLGDSETQNNQYNSSATNSWNTSQQDAQMRMLDMYQKGGIASAGGLTDLYKSAPGDVGQMYQQRLQGIQGKYGTQNDFWNTLRGNKGTGTDWGKWANVAATAYGTYANSQRKP